MYSMLFYFGGVGGQQPRVEDASSFPPDFKSNALLPRQIAEGNAHATEASFRGRAIFHYYSPKAQTSL